jgi:signal transduction histidine kinase
MSRTTTFDNTERKHTEEELARHRDHLEAMVGIRTSELALKNIELEKTRLAAVSANQAKSDFLASMSHELRTPLNAIIGFSDVLLGAYFGALNEKQKEYTMDILESGKHLLNLINDVLDISKVEAGKMELELTPVEIGNLLASCIVMIKEKTHKHGIDLKVDIPKELLGFEMFADQRKIKQIMFNLLSNAAKFTPDGGVIMLSAVHMLQEGKGFLEVSVTDTGIGIPREYQEKIFESFYQIRGGLTDKTPGTGLGLSVAKQLVELHGGEIRLKSGGREKGSQFRFTLPVKAN